MVKIKALVVQPEREIEEIWRNFRISEEFDENPLKKLYSPGGAYFGNPGCGNYSSGLENNIANALGVMSGTTIYGAGANSTLSGLSGPGSATYSIAPYFMKGSSSSTYRSEASSRLGNSYTTASVQYSGGKGGSGTGSGSAGGGK